MVKIDLAEAFYHFSLAPSTRRLTTFRVDSIYCRFTRLPFGIRPAPFFMQTLSTALTCHLRSLGLWAWSHIVCGQGSHQHHYHQPYQPDTFSVANCALHITLEGISNRNIEIIM